MVSPVENTQEPAFIRSRGWQAMVLVMLCKREEYTDIVRICQGIPGVTKMISSRCRLTVPGGAFLGFFTCFRSQYATGTWPPFRILL
jgi:hypothetical protein